MRWANEHSRRGPLSEEGPAFTGSFAFSWGLTPELVVEPDASRQAEEALGDPLAQAGEGAGAVALQGEEVLLGPEDRLDALAARGQVRPAADLVATGGAHDRGP